MNRIFFDDHPSDLLSTYAKLMDKTAPFLLELNRRLSEYMFIEHSNIPRNIALQKLSAVRKYDLYFSGSSNGITYASEKWCTTEDLESSVHTTSSFHSAYVWKELLEAIKTSDKKVLLFPTYSRRKHDKLKLEFPELIIASPPATLVEMFGLDKSTISDLCKSIGIYYPETLSFPDSSLIPDDFEGLLSLLETNTIVLQATRGASGLTQNGKQSLYVVSNSEQLAQAKVFLSEEGPVKVAPYFEGVTGNTSAVVIPGLGVYISSRPSTKYMGNENVHANTYASSGNQWDNSHGEANINESYSILEKMGNHLAKHGYCGIFGADMIFSKSGIYIPDLNARSQGPDMQRETALIKANLLSSYALQLGSYLGLDKSLFPSPEEYNFVTKWLRVPPYVKVFTESEFIMKSDINGNYISKNGLPYEIVNAPSAGQKVEGEYGYLLCYLNLTDTKTPIYKTNGELTDDALEIINSIYKNAGISENCQY